MDKKFTNNCNTLLNSVSSTQEITGDMARLAHRLSRACNKLDKLEEMLRNTAMLKREFLELEKNFLESED